MRRQAFKLKLMHMWSSESNVEADPTGQTILQQLKTMGIISGRIIVLQNSSKCGRNAQSPENRPSLVLTKPIEENALTTILAGSRRIVGAMFHSCLCFLFSFILEIILSCHTNATFHSWLILMTCVMLHLIPPICCRHQTCQAILTNLLRRERNIIGFGFPSSKPVRRFFGWIAPHWRQHNWAGRIRLCLS